MNNEEKQQLALIQLRLQRLETAMQGVSDTIGIASTQVFNCAECGAYDPIACGHVCSVPDCPMGLNPRDDMKEA